MTALRVIIFLTALFFNCYLVNAQLKPVIHFTEDDGLAGNLVWSVVKDSLNILWIGTNSGISRFDGREFDNLYENNGLPSNNVGALAVGEDNEIYAGCSRGGLVVIRNDSVINLVPQSGKLNEVFRTLFYSRYYSTLFVGTESGLYVLKNNALIPVNYNRDTANRSIVLSITAKDSEMYFTVLKGTSRGFYKLHYNAEKPEKSVASRISVKGRFACAMSGDYVCTSDRYRVYRYHTKNLSQKPSIISVDTNYHVWELSEYKNGLLWVGTLGDGRFRGDILLYDVAKNKIIPGGIPQNIQTVNCILYDSIYGVTWFGRDNGLTAYQETSFSYFDFDGIENILDANNLGDTLFILTEKGVLRYDNNNFKQVLSKDEIADKILSEYESIKHAKRLKLFDITGLELTSFIKDGGKLYVQTGKGAISIPDLKYYVPSGVGRFTVLKNGSVYTATNNMPVIFLKSLKGSMEYVIMEDTLNTSKEIINILESEGVYYFASRINGLLTIKNNKVIRLNDSNSVMENNLKDLDKDLEGRIWCLSESDILYLIEYKSQPEVVKEIALHNTGIIGNRCKWMQFVGDKLYISTNKGLNVISTNTLFTDAPAIKFYNQYNGYKFISSSAPFIDAHGYLNVHTNNEVITIFDDKAEYKPVKLNIIQLKINEVAFAIHKLHNRKLPYSTHQISFVFRGIKYPSARNLSYRYRINDETWISGNKVYLQSLRAGKYIIRLECTDPENNACTTDEIQFFISKPFWATTWFIAMLILTSTLLVYVSLRMRYASLRRRNEEKTRLMVQNSQLQLRSLQIQMNPHFMFNALTCLQNFILSKNVKDGLTYLSTLASIFRSNITNAREEYIFLTKEIEFLLKYIEVEKLRFKDKLHVTLRDETNDPYILIPPMLIQPLIENAIKHGITPKELGGSIRITFKTTETLLIVIVEDNGIGRAASKTIQTEERQHFGLSVIQQRLELLNALEHSDNNGIEVTDLYANNAPAGTRIVITLLLMRG